MALIENKNETSPRIKLKKFPSSSDVEKASSSVMEGKAALADAVTAEQAALAAENVGKLVECRARKDICAAKVARLEGELQECKIHECIGRLYKIADEYRTAREEQHLGKNSFEDFLKTKLDKSAAREISSNKSFWPQDLRNARARRMQARIDFTDTIYELRRLDPKAEARFELPGM